MHAQSAEPKATQQRRNKQEKRQAQRVHSLKPSESGTITGACHFLVRLKPKHFPNRGGLGRFLDRFDMLVRARYAGALWMTMQQNCQHAPLLRHSSGEHHNGGAGTSI
jgi:hypothetical protein